MTEEELALDGWSAVGRLVEKAQALEDIVKAVNHLRDENRRLREALEKRERRFAMLNFHRKEQWDLGPCTPWVCIHWERPDSCTRIFCLWRWGMQIGSLTIGGPRRTED